MPMTSKNQETSQNTTIRINGSAKVWNINKSIEINIPELTEENTIRFEDLMSQFFGGFPVME